MIQGPQQHQYDGILHMQSYYSKKLMFLADSLQDEAEVRKTHFKYGYYLDKCLYNEVSTLPHISPTSLFGAFLILNLPPRSSTSSPTTQTPT